MSEVGVADRTRLLRSKRAELSEIVTSRKRKLRELYAVCDNENPIPQIDLSNSDAPSHNISEARFLEVTDILQDRLFDESNLPTRRQLRSDKLKHATSIRKGSPDARINDASRKAAKLPRDGSRPRKSRAPTPTSRNDGGTSTVPNEQGGDRTVDQGLPMQRSTSKGSQTDLPGESSAVLNKIVEETFENANQPTTPMPDDVVPSKELESDRIRTVVESRPNSPGVDPRQAMPISAEDAAQLPGLIVKGLGSHDGQHKAATAHLPPKEVQEKHLHQAEKARHRKEHRSHLTINPPRDTGRNAEALSSPGSTIDALSATTPAMHEASTDTSPDNENHYDADRMDKGEEVATPPQLKPSPEEAAEKAEHDRILQARVEIARDEIMRSSPRLAEDPPQPEEQVSTPSQQVDDSQPDDNQDQNAADRLTKQASEVVVNVIDVVEDEVMDEVMGVPTSSEDPVPSEPVQAAPSIIAAGKQPEVVDSEEEQSPAGDPMNVDKTTVKDSFESSTALETAPEASPAVPLPIEAAKEAADIQKTSVTPSPSTPRRTTSTPAAPPLERMTTRVASGAMKHKSVSEILGETPKPGTSSSSDRRTDSESTGNSHTPSRSTTPQSPGARLRMLEKAKERSKLSTVVFAGRPTKSSARDNALVANGSASSQSLKDDYFIPLFLATASQGKSGVQPLDTLLASAHKTITTSNAYVPIHENQTAKVLKRIYNLQSSNKWALRQPKRSSEPIRQTTHWDVLLQEAKWMRTDFREERKWKITVARNLAFACAEWAEASPEDRELLQVKAVAPKPIEHDSSRDVEIGDASSQAGTHPTPDLVPSGESDSMEDFDEEPGLHLLETVAPTAIFALQDDEVVCGLRRSPTTDKLLAELPMYGAPLSVPQSVLPTSDVDPDRFWRRPALPLSKYVEGRMELDFSGPPRKKSRFAYEQEDDDEEQVVFGEQRAKRPILPPEKTDVALFNPEHKHIRDRIHSSHQFRPPSEFPMPLQTFFECRQASQWTVDEDVELKSLVREYQYNWSLISSMLQSKSLWSSGPERRTPWECFERWINLEGLPADMQKTHYFRAYSTRIDAANRIVMALPSQAPPQPNANGQVQPVPRRRPTTSVRVDRRRNNKHLTLVDAMRKLAKKRETNIQKQAHAAGMAAMRKQNEPQHNPNRNPLQTPQQFSQLKHDRDEHIKARMEEMHRRNEAQRRAMMQQRNAVQNGLQQSNRAAPQPPAAAVVANGTAAPNNQNLTVPGQNRPRAMPPQMPGQPMPNGLRAPQMVPPAPMQGQLPLPNPALDVGLVTRAHQISQHQQAILRQQQGQINGQSPQMHNSPPRMNGVPQPGFNMPNNMMPPFNPNVNGVSTPPTNSHAPSPGQGQAGSPRMAQNLAAHNANGVSPVQILEMNFKQKYPQATPEQIMRLISDHLANTVKQQQQKQGLAQSAMNAAAGGPAGNGMPGMAGMGPAQGTPQLYAQMLRQQQENQQKAQQQVQQAANVVSNGQNQGQSGGTGNAGPGHAHRASTGSAHSGK